MRILVTGGSGWVGAHLVRHLTEKGHEVINYDIREGYDILDFEILKSQIKDVDEVYHLAAQAFLRPGEQNPYRDIQINQFGMINLLRCLEEYPIPMVYTSSGAVYGITPDLPIREESPCIPVSNYGVSKLAAEGYLRKWVYTKGINARIIRFSSVYGQGRTEGPVNIFINKAINWEDLTIYGTGEQTRDMVYIEDACDGLVLALQKGVPGEIYNIGTGVESSVNQVAEVIKSRFECKVVHIDYDMGPFDVKRSWYDLTKIRALGYEPKYNLKEGIGLTIQEELDARED